MTKWYHSKTLWINGLALAATLVQGITGTAWITPEYQVAALGVVNVILRIVTKTGLEV
jgi:hypothetical protein